MWVMMAKSTVEFNGNIIKEFGYDPDGLVWFIEYEDPDTKIELYKAADERKAKYIYDQITKGLSQGWLDCKLMEQTK